MNLASHPVPAGERHVHLFRIFTVCVSNLNGWNTVPERPEKPRGAWGKLVERHVYAFKMFRRHHLSVVGVVEHHLRDEVQLSSACHTASRHGFSFVGNHSLEQKFGVGLLYDKQWSFVRSFSVGPRLLVGVLRHSEQFDVAFAVGHFHNNPQLKLAQWKALGHVADWFDDLPVVFLADLGCPSCRAKQSNSWFAAGIGP